MLRYLEGIIFSSPALAYWVSGMEGEERVHGSTTGSFKHHWGEVALAGLHGAGRLWA